MTAAVVLLLVLLGMGVLLAQPASRPITVEWRWDETGGEVFVLERCVQRGQRCVMVPVATLPLTLRLWVDTAVVRQRDYCYRIAVQADARLGPWSNTLCSS